MFSLASAHILTLFSPVCSSLFLFPMFPMIIPRSRVQTAWVKYAVSPAVALPITILPKTPKIYGGPQKLQNAISRPPSSLVQSPLSYRLLVIAPPMGKPQIRETIITEKQEGERENSLAKGEKAFPKNSQHPLETRMEDKTRYGKVEGRIAFTAEIHAFIVLSEMIFGLDIIRKNKINTMSQSIANRQLVGVITALSLPFLL